MAAKQGKWLDQSNRQFHEPAPDRLWLLVFVYVATWTGFVYAAFAIDAYARRIVGWRESRTAHTGFVLVYKNDVWKSADGVTWTEVPQTVAFPPRMYNAVEVVNGHFVVAAGYDGTNMVDTWISKDGAIWRQVTGIPWVARHATSTVVHDGEVLMLGGPLDETAVWAMR